MQTGVGVSSLAVPGDAAREAARGAKLECATPKLVLAFMSHAHPIDGLADVRDELRAVFPGAVVAGATVNGVVYDGARHDAYYGARVVGVLALDGIELGVAQIACPSDPVEGGRELALAARRRLGRPSPGGILFSPGLSAEPSIDPALLDGIREILPGIRLSGTGCCGGLDLTGVPLSGATFLDDQLESRGALLVLLGGDIRVGAAGANGLHSTGHTATVTKAVGPMVQELDGRPARNVVLELLAPGEPETQAQLTRAPTVLCVERSVSLAEERAGFFWLHMPAAFLPDGSMVDPFHPRIGMKLTTVDLNRQSCLDAIGEAAALLVEELAAHELELVLSFSCALRGFTLGGESSNEDGLLASRLRARRRLGIIANGEIACHRQQGPFATGWLYSLFGVAQA